jgi:2-methylisocitrate lyase-like PEP mutase family enzyme
MIEQTDQADLIGAIRHAVPELVINARVDVYLRKAGGLEDAVRRANAYLDAGADCAYPIFCPPEDIPGLAEGIAGPVNVLARPGVPGPAELERVGVARLTWGAGLAGAAYAEAARIAGAGLAEAT